MLFFRWVVSFFFFVFFLYILIFILTHYFKGLSFSKNIAFECGFNPFSTSGGVFSMPFFLISLIFLLFDVEIILLCFYPIIGGVISLDISLLWLVLFLIGGATFYEWFRGVLGWFSSLKY